MSAPLTATTANIQITDQTLLPFHQMRETVFNQTLETFDKLSPQWEKDYTSLKHFELAVRKQGGKLQHSEIPIIVERDLNASKEKDLQIYWWVFKLAIDKIDTFASDVQKVIAFLKPDEKRSYQEEQRIEKEQPDLFAQIKRSKEICLGHVVKLNTVHNKTIEMKGRMVAIIGTETNNVNWSLQRFCQIVDNKGQPINVLTRSWNNLSPFVSEVALPKPQGQYSEEAIEKLRVELQKMAVDNEKPAILSNLSVGNVGANQGSLSSSSATATTSTTTISTTSGTSNTTVNSETSAQVANKSENSAPKQETANATGGETAEKSDAGTQQTLSKGKSESSAPKQETASNATTTTSANTTAPSNETAVKNNDKLDRKGSIDSKPDTNVISQRHKRKDTNS